MSQFGNSNKNRTRYNENREGKGSRGGGNSGNVGNYRYNQNQPPPPSSSSSSSSYNSHRRFNQQTNAYQSDANPRNQPRNPVDPKVSSLRAECMQMCSPEERQMRIYNKLVNPLEIKTVDSRTEYVLVKEYSRPAAGKIIKSTDLRPIDVLVETTNYLAKEIFSQREKNYLQNYEFLFDRFRSIRQDLTIQRLDASEPKTLSILKTILKFYLISDYKLCYHQGYDSYINSQHLNEVLNHIVSHLQSPGSVSDAKASDDDYNAIFLCVFMLINVNNWTNLNNLVKVRWLRSNAVYQQCLDLCRNYIQHNYVRVLRIYQKLPLICQLAFHDRIPSIHIELFKRYNAAFSFKNSKYPIDTLVELTLLNHRISLAKYVRAGLLQFDEEDENVVFAKSNTGNSVKEEREHLKVIDDKLDSVDQVDFLLNDYEV